MDVANFVIALIGLIAAVASLVWQAVTFVLSGIRPQCKMMHGAINPGRQYATYPIVGRTLRLPGSVVAQGFTEEALFVTVHNAGRLPFSVKSWHLVLEGGVSTGVLNNPFGPALPHRLDVGEEATWAIEMSQAQQVADAWRSQRGGVSVPAWMEVQVGNGKTYRSKEVVDL
ncbi:hypothetical protein ACFZDK_41125 [Streptomyces sp. NPDC007901]|uniref:hypothetical protein n=1 Tax=Streptomyces sp. NPDC007901 TaxID=3364785 RepID=UPI0036E0D1C9